MRLTAHMEHMLYRFWRDGGGVLVRDIPKLRPARLEAA